MQPRRRIETWEVETQPDLVACTPEALDALARGADPQMVEEALRAMQRAEGAGGR